MKSRPGIFSAPFFAVLALTTPAVHGQEADDVAALSKPASSFSAGVGLVGKDSLRYGQYTGMTQHGGYGLLDLYLTRRDEASGRWLELTGRNLGLDNRELRFEHRLQGSWGYFIDFSQTPRASPYVYASTLAGIDSRTQVEGGTARRDLRLETRRDALSLGFDRQLGRGFDFNLRYRHEDKNGMRPWGRNSVRFLVDPIDNRTQQWEATAGYTGDRLQLSGGYYGTMFQNQNAFVEAQATGTTPIALPPGNRSHQFSLAGGYGFTPTTRGTFKVAYGRALQDDLFFLRPLASVPRTDLGGRIDTKQLQLGISSRPLPKLSLRADLRHERRHDRTPVYVYTTLAGAVTADGTNEPRSFTTTVGKLEASYAMPMGFRLTGGADLDLRKRNTSEIRAVSFREKTEETAYRAELRRSLSDTLNGAISFVTGRRDGSAWYTNIRQNGTLGSNLIHPLHLADRDRDKLRIALDWAPLEPLSLNLVIEDAKDSYSGRSLGPRSGKAKFYSLDAAYQFSEKWQATAWFSRNDTSAEQATCENASTGGGVCPNTAADPLWEARLRNLGDAVGFGVRGKPNAVLDLGADYSFTKDRGEFRQTPLRGGVAAATVPAIPDVNYRRTNLSLHGSYAVNKQASVRLQYVYERFRTDDWYWTNFVYGDGTTVSQNPNQVVHFIGASYRYEFR